jgi:hypothetical protein
VAPYREKLALLRRGLLMAATVPKVFSLKLILEIG